MTVASRWSTGVRMSLLGQDTITSTSRVLPWPPATARPVRAVAASPLEQDRGQDGQEDEDQQLLR